VWFFLCVDPRCCRAFLLIWSSSQSDLSCSSHDTRFCRAASFTQSSLQLDQSASTFGAELVDTRYSHVILALFLVKLLIQSTDRLALKISNRLSRRRFTSTLHAQCGTIFLPNRSPNQSTTHVAIFLRESISELRVDNCLPSLSTRFTQPSWSPSGSRWG